MSRLFSISALALVACGDADSIINDALEDAGLVLDANSAPVLTLYSPVDQGRYSGSDAVEMSLHISDDDSPSELLVEVWSNVDGSLGSYGVDAVGNVHDWFDSLSVGFHTLNFRVTDTAGQFDNYVVDVEILANQPPTAPVIEIEPSAPRPGDDLELLFVSPSVDPEGEAVTYDISWFVDGVETMYRKDFVPAEDTRAGQIWTAIVEATDGEMTSEIVSVSTTVSSMAPEVDVWITPSKPKAGDVLTCSWSAGDSYGSSVDVSSEWVLSGEVVSDAGDPLVDIFVKDDVVSCEVYASSAHGSSLVSAAVQIENTPPMIEWVGVQEIDPANSSDIECVGVAFDEDDDTLSWDYVWMVNGEPSGQTEAVFPASILTHGDTFYCQARVSDGEASTPFHVSGVLTY